MNMKYLKDFFKSKKEEVKIDKGDIEDALSPISDMGTKIDIRVYNNMSNIEILIRFDKKLTFNEDEVESELNNSISLLSGMGFKFPKIFVSSYFGNLSKSWDDIDDGFRPQTRRQNGERVEKEILDNKHGYFFLETGRHIIIAIFGKYIYSNETY